MIKLDNVSISVRGTAVLSHCTANLPGGSVTHLAGDNGSGKTTLIRAIAGIQRHSGDIRFDGADVARVRARLYVCFDDAPLFPYLSGYENVRMLLGRPLRAAAIAAVAPAIADHALLRLTARRLSHGQRKRLHLVAALASGARYLVLDEALDGVDAPTAIEVFAALASRAHQTTTLLTGHGQEALANLATQRIALRGGTIVDESAGATTQRGMTA